MGAPRGVLEFVERLEGSIADLVSGARQIALAYSGGLSSTLVAMVARKRCDLVCVVVGVNDSEAVRAAKAAKAHLDYRVQFVRLDLEETLRIRDGINASNRRLPPSVLRALVPLRAVLEETHEPSMLTGLGSRPIDAKIGMVLQAWGAQSPLLDLSRGHPLPRSLLREAAISLGLPAEWAGVRHRAPATSAGIEDFLRTSRSLRP